ncbi:class I SAM-dependent methyltransferase [Meridianimarinicoccus roseus]|uniref:class I SAM-dependent methyltransferase n=1 Tax=Meridianimarinicoccus roseus TaxID=2072018 RepID=UPI001EE644AC|nr:class I SAM-dependent methyltransferase [Meridianimarinicoccus roseus]
MSPGAAGLAALRDAIPAVYQRQAAVWDAQRPRGLHERAWLERAVAGLAPGAPVLDLGCGAGDPIAGWLIGQGFAVTGLDVAPAMLALARARFPQACWLEGDMRGALPDGPFGAILGWDSVFHLVPADQRALIPRLVARLAPGGRLLVSVGPRAGEELGRVGGEPVYHASLDPDDYRALCRAAGCAQVRLVTEDPDCDFRSLLLARRAG